MIQLITLYSIRFLVSHITAIKFHSTKSFFFWNKCVVIVQMEGVSIFYPDEWGSAGLDATEYAAKDLKRCLEGLARHLFGKTTLVFSMGASHKLKLSDEYI